MCRICPYTIQSFERGEHMDKNKKPAEFQQYFSSLPLNVQETIQQSAVEVQTVDELRRLAQNLMRGQ